MDNRYMQYLPETVRELREFQKLGEIEDIILEEEALAKDTLTENQWILTARRSGLLRLAKIMGILGAEQMETEPLREEILHRWSSRSPYTYFHLQDWLNGCVGDGSYQLELKREQYILKLMLELRVKERKVFLEKHLRKIIPANLILQVDLNVNTYEKLKAMTHGKLKALGLTHGEIPYEDITVYKESNEAESV